jgi:hypothetical protein
MGFLQTGLAGAISWFIFSGRSARRWLIKLILWRFKRWGGHGIVSGSQEIRIFRTGFVEFLRSLQHGFGFVYRNISIMVLLGRESREARIYTQNQNVNARDGNLHQQAPSSPLYFKCLHQIKSLLHHYYLRLLKWHPGYVTLFNFISCGHSDLSHTLQDHLWFRTYWWLVLLFSGTLLFMVGCFKIST